MSTGWPTASATCATSAQRSIEPIQADEDAWVEHVNDVSTVSLRSTCSSWYVGANIPGRPRVFMPYIGGFPVYVQKCNEVMSNGFDGFVIEGAAAEQHRTAGALHRTLAGPDRYRRHLTGGGRREACAGGVRLSDRRVGKGALRGVPTIQHIALDRWWARRKRAFAHPTALAHRRPLRLDDLEHARKFIHQHHQFTEPHRIAGEFYLAAADRILKRRLFRDHLVEHTARQREAGVRAWPPARRRYRSARSFPASEQTSRWYR